MELVKNRWIPISEAELVGVTPDGRAIYIHRRDFGLPREGEEDC